MARTARATRAKAENGHHRASRVPLGETPPEAFIRLAQERVKRMLRQLDSLGKLARRRKDYSPEQVEEMLAAIEDGVMRCRHRFAGEGASQAEFRFTAPGPVPH